MLLRHSGTDGSPALRRRRRTPRQFVPMWRRSALVPPDWRVVDDSGVDSFGRALPAPGTRTLELWRLTLEAQNIPHLVVGHGANQRIFVPALREGAARAELAALAAESRPRQVSVVVPRHNAHWALLALLVLVFWHGLRMGWWPLPVEHLPDPDYWLTRGGLDVYRVRVLGEWWRTATALTLHADSLHLFSNLLFGAPFLILIARRLGLGLALGLTLLAGIMGNTLNALYRPLDHTSVGFSTSLFGMVGILCADIAVRDNGHGFKRRVLLPLAAGLALLAMLGAEGERTDYAAHIFGLLSGFGLGLVASSILKRHGPPPLLLEWSIGVAVPFFLLWCWDRAFQ